MTMLDRPQVDLSSLKFAIQYRSKRDGGAWTTMAAFDGEGPAKWYFDMQGGPDRPWEYQLVEIPAPESSV